MYQIFQKIFLEIFILVIFWLFSRLLEIRIISNIQRMWCRGFTYAWDDKSLKFEFSRNLFFQTRNVLYFFPAEFPFNWLFLKIHLSSYFLNANN